MYVFTLLVPLLVLSAPDVCLHITAGGGGAAAAPAWST